MDMKEQKFALEIRVTGITRKKTAQILSEQFNTNFLYEGGSGFIYSFNDNLNRKWRIVKDDSIKEQTVNSPANQNYRVKIITPILNYNDMRTIEEAVDNLKSNDAIINDSCKIDIYVDSTPYKTTNLANIHKLMFSKEDMLCRALDIKILDENKLSAQVDDEKLKNIMFHKPSSDYELNQKWYTNYDGYLNKILDLETVKSKGMIGFGMFKSSFDNLQTYIQLCLAVSKQALEQKNARAIKTQSTNEKYTFRTWLLKLGFIGEEYKVARQELLRNLEGNIAWKNPENAHIEYVHQRNNTTIDEQVEVKQYINENQQKEEQNDNQSFVMSM